MFSVIVMVLISTCIISASTEMLLLQKKWYQFIPCHVMKTKMGNVFCFFLTISNSHVSLPSRGPSVPSVTMIATSWRSTPPSTPPLRSLKPFRHWCPLSSVRSNMSLICWTRAAMKRTARMTANQQRARRRMNLARRSPVKPKMTATGGVAVVECIVSPFYRIRGNELVYF